MPLNETSLIDTFVFLKNGMLIIELCKATAFEIPGAPSSVFQNVMDVKRRMQPLLRLHNHWFFVVKHFQ